MACLPAGRGASFPWRALGEVTDVSTEKGGEQRMKRPEKQQVISELQEKFSRAKAAVLTEYRGLSVHELEELRIQLRGVDVEYRVVKNTLAVRAAAGTGLECLRESFTGPVGIALSYRDPLSPAKVLTEFAKKQEKLRLVVGALEGRVVSAEGLKGLATLPGLDQLRARLVGLLQAPAARLARVLAAPGTQVARVMKARSEQVH